MCLFHLNRTDMLAVVWFIQLANKGRFLRTQRVHVQLTLPLAAVGTSVTYAYKLPVITSKYFHMCCKKNNPEL